MPSGRARIVVASTAGIFVESLDWTLYGLLAPYFAGQMFPGHDHFSQVLSAYLVFAAGFVVRPIGGLVMGRITDRRGRRAGLVVAVSLMATGSAVLAAAPTYAAAGLAGPVLFVLARLLQAVAMGGEVATAATYVVEVAPAHRRYRYGSFAYAGDGIGTLIGTVVLALLLALFGDDGVSGGAWRWAFVLGAVCGLLAVWVRTGVPESAVFQAARRGVTPPLGPLFRAHRPRMALAFALTIGSTMGVYFGSVYLPQFAGHTGRISQDAATGQQTVALVVLLAAMIASGVLADRFGPLRLIRLGFTGAAVLVLPLMLGLAAGWVPYLVAAPVFTLCVGLQLGVTPVAGARLFPVPIRAVALGVPAALAIAVFGGSLPAVAEWLTRTVSVTAVPIYVFAGLAVSAFGAWLVRESLLYPPDTLGSTDAAVIPVFQKETRA